VLTTKSEADSSRKPDIQNDRISLFAVLSINQVPLRKGFAQPSKFAFSQGSRRRGI
jgi:hypothetical protein